MKTLSLVDPRTNKKWDEYVLAFPACSIFHSISWAETLLESYAYRPVYFTLFDQNRLAACVPMVEVNSVITGRRGVSLPFSDFVEPLAETPSAFWELFEELLKFGKKAGWKYFELRGGDSFLEKERVFVRFLTHSLDLIPGEESLFSNFNGPTRRNIRKAQKEGVKVFTCYSIEAMREFYRLNCMTRRLHGLPPQPWQFFKNLTELLVQKGYGMVMLAVYKSLVVAGGVFLHFGKSAFFKYGASDKRYQHLRANNLVMWEAIRWYVQMGFTSFSFGRTELSNEGLRRFKLGFGASEKKLSYWRYDLRNNMYSKLRITRPDASYPVFRRLPIPLLQAIGTLLYRHVG